MQAREGEIMNRKCKIRACTRVRPFPSSNKYTPMEKMASGVFCVVCCAISIALLLLAAPTVAQQPRNTESSGPAASIAGRITVVTGEGAANAFAGVTVKLISTASGTAPQSAVTDAEGRYQFTHLTAGSYTVETSEQGFQPSSTAITLAAGQALVADIVLKITSVDQQVEVQ